MSKQDINLVRTPQDLERKYDLGSIGQLKQNFELQKESLTKVENELIDFAKATTKDIEEIKNQVDGNITTWFSSGIPTLENYPANEWLIEEDYNNHLGDLYYDNDTGYSYRFIQKDGTYSWGRITDSDVTEALAIANAAKDTADRKRQVFVVEPIPPYDVGDLWLRNEEIYRCQTSRPSGETFEDNDWIKATKYTDDTVANQVGNNLTILSGTVTEIRQDVDKLNTTMTNTTRVVDEQGNTIGKLQEKQSETSQTVDGITTRVSSVENGLSATNSNLSNLSDIVNTNIEDTSTLKANVTTLEQTDESIRVSVTEISSDVSEMTEDIHTVQETITSQEATIKIISKNIITDGDNAGDITEVTTTTGFTFNADGMTINDDSGFKAEHRADGTYYKDGESTVGKYTKDGSKQRDLELFGTYSYGKEDIDDTPMFVAQLYEDENGEECFGHFYNGGDY